MQQQKKHQNSILLALCEGNPPPRWSPSKKDINMRKAFAYHNPGRGGVCRSAGSILEGGVIFIKFPENMVWFYQTSLK